LHTGRKRESRTKGEEKARLCLLALVRKEGGGGAKVDHYGGERGKRKERESEITFQPNAVKEKKGRKKS